MPIIVDCPSCGRKLRVSDESLGRKMQCPGCEMIFDTETAWSAPPPEKEKPTAPETDDASHCPHCAETVSRNDARCRYCGEDLLGQDGNLRESRSARRDSEPERGGVVLTMGIVSLFVPVVGIFLGLAAWVMGAKDLGKMRRREMDPRGEGTTRAGLICGIIGLVMQVLLTLLCGAPILLTFLMAYGALRSVGPTPVPPAAVAPAPFPEEPEFEPGPPPPSPEKK